ncbi:MAG: hypothetical protein DWQ07_08445 [Chloroflexi bacterium]|nr:MAG: hypothetical protein DWQ07_08445 [Chloroflexota bacterium]MBL1193259.1 hypothetical protein [Chloroflexota bacterium]NOH10552.1 hypothetical protein [Chloroflexota bacterium]
MQTRRKRRKTAGKRHTLIVYRRMMTRILRTALIADLGLWVTYYFARLGRVPALYPPRDLILLAGAAIGLIVVMLIMVARIRGFVQARLGYLVIATSIFTLKISYRRVLSARPVEFGQLYSPAEMKWGDKNFLQPYFGKTILAIITKGYPVSPRLLRLFFPKYFIHPKDTGFLLIIEDWMGLSTEIDQLMNTWREKRGPKRTRGNTIRGMYGQ